MPIISYFESEHQQELTEKLAACDWSAAKFLLQLLSEDLFLTCWGDGASFIC